MFSNLQPVIVSIIFLKPRGFSSLLEDTVSPQFDVFPVGSHLDRSENDLPAATFTQRDIMMTYNKVKVMRFMDKHKIVVSVWAQFVKVQLSSALTRITLLLFCLTSHCSQVVPIVRCVCNNPLDKMGNIMSRQSIMAPFNPLFY